MSYRWAPLALALLVTGCGTSERQQAVRYHEQVALATRMVEAADLRFLISLLPLLRSETFDAGSVASAQLAARRAVEEAARRIAEASPPDTTSARQLAATHRAFLDRQRRTVEVDFAEVAKLAGDGAMDAALRRSKVRDLFVRVQDADYTDFKALRKAQKAYADEHKLPLADVALPQDRALAFLTALSVANGRLELGGKELGAALLQAFEERGVRDDRVQRALDDARRTLATVKEIVTALDVPPGPAAGRLRDAQLAYLDRQKVIFDGAFPELMRIAHDPLLPLPDRRQRLDTVLRSMQESERGELIRLAQAREAFIKENRLVSR